MSQQSTRSTYAFAFNFESNGVGNEGFFSLTSDAGVTDEFAFALVEAFNALPWPGGADTPMSVTKSTSTQVLFGTDMEAEPPIFT